MTARLPTSSPRRGHGIFSSEHGYSADLFLPSFGPRTQADNHLHSFSILIIERSGLSFSLPPSQIAYRYTHLRNVPNSSTSSEQPAMGSVHIDCPAPLLYRHCLYTSRPHSPRHLLGLSHPYVPSPPHLSIREHSNRPSRRGRDSKVPGLLRTS
jgi:hypothetical protein